MPRHQPPLPSPIEPLLTRHHNLRSAFPIRIPTLWNMFLAARETYWLPTRLDLEEDKRQWATSMAKGEKWIVTRALAFFATSNGIVADNIICRFCQEVAYSEAKYFYGFQVVKENVHAETYAKLIDAVVPDLEEQAVLLRWSTIVPSIAFKNIWAVKWMLEARRSFADRLVAFICVQVIFSASSFAAMGWLKSRNKMPGLSLAIDMISKDGRSHLDFACALFRRVKTMPTESVIREIIREATDIEAEYATGASNCLVSVPATNLTVDLLSGSEHGLDLQEMVLFIRFVADHLLLKLGYKAAFNAYNPVS
ncbi:ribonucleotide reductase small subunit [Ephemerocybe angulata]|uniref:Ribonucleotide reductase small subunit n=1 Tax=Ephemerocybe angulata TaxID=980116 RepID=A0A8H6I2B4_9AGAR|nr:ribonucleotide reductase small subunit [Tulosesus angulatus]